MFRKVWSFRLTLVHFNMCTVYSSGDAQTKFHLLPHFLNHVSCYSFNGWCDPFLQVLDIPIFSAYTMFLMYPHRKKSSGERSGLRGGQGIGPPLPFQASRNFSFKTSVTKQLKCSKVTPSPARAHDSPPAWKSPQRLKVTNLRFPCQWRAPLLFRLSLILNLI